MTRNRRPRNHRHVTEPIQFARALRTVMTETEQTLWSQLRDRQLRDVKFRRQHPLGPFCCDFYAPEVKIDIECDGTPHESDSGRISDDRRDAWMKKQGVTVLRFRNEQIDHNLAEVLQEIDRTIQRLRRASHLTPNPSPPEERGAKPS